MENESPSPEIEFFGAPVEDPPKPSRKGWIILSWLVISAWVALIVVAGSLSRRAAPESTEAESPPDSVLELQGKYLVGVSQLPNIDGAEVFSQGDMPEGSVIQRLSSIVLAGEFLGPQEALARLDQLSALIEQHPEVPAWQQTTAKQLRTLYSDYAEEKWSAPSLSQRDRMDLNRRLGWYGVLALTPENSKATAQRQAIEDNALAVAMSLLAAVLLGLAVGVGGLVGGVILGYLAFAGLLRSRLLAGALHGGVYAETFALWMTTYALAGMAVSLLPLEQLPMLAVQLVMVFACLITLLWPVIRGVPWSTVMDDIGWKWPDKWYEPALGVVLHICNAPLMLFGLATTFALMHLASLLPGDGANPLAPIQAPTHPVVEWVREVGWLGKLTIVMLACVAAPIAEETMFRGVLYRQLRDMTVSWRIGLSVVFSALINGLVFAAVHPQGVFAIPMLTSLAVGFSLMREWRGSLVAPMSAHAFNNGMVMLLLFSLI